MKRTPLYDTYHSYDGVKLVDFGGWELPLHFRAGISGEHTAVRTAAGLFDVSHMGECVISGDDAAAYLEYLCTNSIADLAVGRSRYTMMCYPDGTVVDDILVYRRSETTFLLVLNASNTDKDLAWIRSDNPRSSHCPEVIDISATTALLALQGPKAVEILKTMVGECDLLESFAFRSQCEIDDVFALVSRTGYTGEDGFEIFCNVDDAPKLWNMILERGEPFGVLPCGLGSRDSLRIEAKLPLYGHEISEHITPLEANLGAFVKLDKGDFCGRDALLAQQEGGIPRSLRGLEMIDRGVPRQGYPVHFEGREIGAVTSGTKSPTLGGFWAFALVDRSLSLKFGSQVEVMIHGQRKRARIVKSPFYRRER
ncbi:MAG: glycine cleavage system aminomethyltransferase GcvT [Sphaerochaeta sp.]|nr:glycine cleavage system aminomethyltransferase GcvT [Sphaerochaeta sp.]